MSIEVFLLIVFAAAMPIGFVAVLAWHGRKIAATARAAMQDLGIGLSRDKRP